MGCGGHVAGRLVVGGGVVGGDHQPVVEVSEGGWLVDQGLDVALDIVQGGDVVCGVVHVVLVGVDDIAAGPALREQQDSGDTRHDEETAVHLICRAYISG